jgi:PTS system mannose-specific IIB component
MAENNLLFTRIDDRLIHGQVMTAWIKVYNQATHVLVVDDKVSQDSFMKQMFQLLLPSGITIDILSVDDAVAAFQKGLPKPTIMIVKVPLTIKQLVDKGVKIDYVNVGGMGMSAGRKKFYKNIAASDEERQIFQELLDKGVDIDVQIIPSSQKISMKDLLK